MFIIKEKKMGAEGIITTTIVMNKSRRLSEIIIDIEKEKNEFKKISMITLAFKFLKPSIWMLPIEYKNWNKIKKMYKKLTWKKVKIK